MALIDVIPVTIVNGKSLSPEVALGAKTLVGIVMPGAWTAAGLTFRATADGGGTFNELQDGAGAALTFTVTAGILVQVEPAKWRGADDIKRWSGPPVAPV